MAQSTFSVRMDDQLKEQFSNLCKAFGMNMSTAINVFARAVVRERRMPFEISDKQPDITRTGAIAASNSIRSKALEDGLTDIFSICCDHPASDQIQGSCHKQPVPEANFCDVIAVIPT